MQSLLGDGPDVRWDVGRLGDVGDCEEHKGHNTGGTSLRAGDRNIVFFLFIKVSKGILSKSLVSTSALLC